MIEELQPECFRKSRTRHACDGCCGDILPGQIYQDAVYVDGGRPYHWRICPACLDCLENQDVRQEYEMRAIDECAFSGCIWDIAHELGVQHGRVQESRP